MDLLPSIHKEDTWAPINLGNFREWLHAYSQASKESDPLASAELFAHDAKYYETPFAEPMVGKDAIYQYWAMAARNLKDKEFDFEILAVNGNAGLARWQGTFFNVRAGNKIALDCLFLVEFDENRKCRLFREWWHSQVIEVG